MVHPQIKVWRPIIAVLLRLRKSQMWVWRPIIAVLLRLRMVEFQKLISNPSTHNFLLILSLAFLWREQADYTSGFIHSCMNSNPIPLMLSVLTSILL